jgi:hypothetical protein
MRHRFRPAGLAFLTAVLVTSGGLPWASRTLLAQQPASEPRERSIEVSVTYSLLVPIKPDDQPGQREALEAGRRALYEMAASECQVLEATIASSCRLERLNLHSSVQRQGAAGQSTAQLGANASYRVGLKPRP